MIPACNIALEFLQRRSAHTFMKASLGGGKQSRQLQAQLLRYIRGIGDSNFYLGTGCLAWGVWLFIKTSLKKKRGQNVTWMLLWPYFFQILYHSSSELSPYHGTLSSARRIHSTPSQTHNPKVNFNTNFPSTTSSSWWNPSFRFSYPNCACISVLPICASCPAKLTLLQIYVATNKNCEIHYHVIFSNFWEPIAFFSQAALTGTRLIWKKVKVSAPLYRNWGSVQAVRPIGGVEV